MRTEGGDGHYAICNGISCPCYIAGQRETPSQKRLLYIANAELKNRERILEKISERVELMQAKVWVANDMAEFIERRMSDYSKDSSMAKEAYEIISRYKDT